MPDLKQLREDAEPYPGQAPCPACFESSGYVWVHGNDWNSGPWSHETNIPCDHCNGTGTVDSPLVTLEDLNERAAEELETNMEHVIFMEAMPANPGGFALEAGYFGPVPGVGMNHYIYSRVPKEKAWRYSAPEAARIVQHMHEKGYAAKCEPPITLTL